MAGRSDKMRDSLTYQAVLEEGRADLERIEHATLCLLDAASWDDALADP